MLNVYVYSGSGIYMNLFPWIDMVSILTDNIKFSLSRVIMAMFAHETTRVMNT